MGQKINPTGLRIGVIKNWESRWYANPNKFGDTLVEDYNLREYLLEKLAPAGVPKVEIERDAKRVYINIHCAKPGMVIGRQGAEIEKLKKICEKKLGGKEVSLNIVEIKQPDLNAQLVAESIASQLERRVSYRRALKQAIGRTMKLGARASRLRFPAVSAALRSPVQRLITRALSLFRPSERTSTTALPRLRPLTAESASRFGSTEARFCARAETPIPAPEDAEKEVTNNAFT